MAERRQAVRREPIEVVIEDGRVFTAKPLPWMSAGDLGNEILRQNAEGVNEFVRLFVTEGEQIPQIELKLQQKITDWLAILRLAFPENTIEDFSLPRVLDVDECASLVIASLEVNHLEHLKHLVDPNSPALLLPGGNDSPEEKGTVEQIFGQRIASLVGSSSEESPETPSSNSLEESS